MIGAFSKFLKGLNSRIKITITGMAIYNWGRNLSSPYNQLYAESLGATSFELGLLYSISIAISSILSIPLGWLTERFGVRKIILLGLIFFFFSSVFYSYANIWFLLIPALLLTYIIRLFPLADIVFINMTNPKQRGTVMSLSRVIWSALSISAPIVAAFIVSSFGGKNTEGIRPLYFIQLILIFLVLILFIKKLKPLPTNQDKKGYAPSFFENFKGLFNNQRYLKRWIILRLIRNFATGLVFPFIPLWIFNVKGASLFIYATMATISIVVSLLLQIPAGKLADKIGRKKVFFLLRPLSYIGSFILILSPSPEYLIIVGILGIVGMEFGAITGIGGISFTSFITMYWEMVPEEKRGRWFGIDGIVQISMIPATFLGGILWQQGFMIEILLLPILLEVLLVMPIMLSVPETLGRDNV